MAGSRNPSLECTKYREDVGRQRKKMHQCLIPNAPTCHAGTHANPIHNGAAPTLPPAVRRRREVSGGAEEGGGVNLFVQQTSEKTERQM